MCLLALPPLAFLDLTQVRTKSVRKKEKRKERERVRVVYSPEFLWT